MLELREQRKARMQQVVSAGECWCLAVQEGLWGGSLVSAKACGFWEGTACGKGSLLLEWEVARLCCSIGKGEAVWVSFHLHPEHSALLFGHSWRGFLHLAAAWFVQGS